MIRKRRPQVRLLGNSDVLTTAAAGCPWDWKDLGHRHRTAAAGGQSEQDDVLAADQPEHTQREPGGDRNPPAGMHEKIEARPAKQQAHGGRREIVEIGSGIEQEERGDRDQGGGEQTAERAVALLPELQDDKQPHPAVERRGEPRRQPQAHHRREH